MDKENRQYSVFLHVLKCKEEKVTEIKGSSLLLMLLYRITIRFISVSLAWHLPKKDVKSQVRMVTEEKVALVESQ